MKKPAPDTVFKNNEPAVIVAVTSMAIIAGNLSASDSIRLRNSIYDAFRDIRPGDMELNMLFTDIHVVKKQT